VGFSVLFYDTDWSPSFRKIKTPRKSKQRIIRVTSQMIWRSTALAPLLKIWVGWSIELFCPSNGKLATKYKVNVISLNYENSKIVNFATLRNMILENARRCMYTIRVRSSGNMVV